MPVSFSAAQEGLQTIFQLLGAEAPRLLNSVSAFVLDGPVDDRRLGLAASSVVARHEMLRARYSVVDRTYTVGDPWPVLVRRVAPAADSADGVRQEGRVAAFAALLESAAAPFDPAAGRPVRVELVPLDGDLHLLGVTIDHMLCDQTSLAVIASEMMADYCRSLSSDGSTPVTPPRARYADYSNWQRERRAVSARREQQLAYWSDRMRGVRCVDRPFGLARRQVWSLEGCAMHFEIDGPMRAGLAALAASRRATMFAAVLAALGDAFGSVCDSDEVTIVTLPAHRPRPEFRRIVGLFANFALLRLTGLRSAPWPRRVDQASETIVGALDHGDVMLSDLATVPGVLPLFDQSRSFWPLVHYLDEPGRDLAPPGAPVTLTPFVHPGGTLLERRMMLPVDVHLIVRDHGDKMTGELRCNRGVFDGDSARDLLTAVGTSLGRAAGALEPLPVGLTGGGD